MKSRTLIVAAAMSAFSLTAFANDRFPNAWPMEKQVELKDGGRLLLYKDGKMAVEDKYGNPVWTIKSGGTVEARNGEKITVNSNEIQRLDRSHLERN